MKLTDSFSLALRTVKSNRLRTGITVAIIAFGIMALIGIITAIEAMNQSLKESFSSMGANAFNIRYKESRVRFGGNSGGNTVTKRGKKEKKSRLDKPIQLEEAEYFKNNFNYPSRVSIYIRGGGNFECHYEDKKTNPITTLWGGDENYLNVTGYMVNYGRNFSNLEVSSGRNVCLLGDGTAKKLFGDNVAKSIDKVIRVGSIPYKVIGVLKSKGSSSFLRQDDVVITTYNNARKLSTVSPSYLVGVIVNNLKEMDAAIG
ncbi:MAG: ABC transporter permease, partial [Chitinophagaceae bacterium]